MTNLIALDFDGVICDGLVEYFATTKRAYHRIWTEESETTTDKFAEVFCQLRPVIETGWEMPVLLRSLVLEINQETIFTRWNEIREEIISQEKLSKKLLSKTLDGVRDDWIRNDLDSWLSLHRFYPGVLAKIQQILNSHDYFYIITTKEGRFVKQLLERQGISLATDKIIGKEYQRPKYETLRLLKNTINADNLSIFFVEDRLNTLSLIQQQPDLEEVNSFLADWGYNTELERRTAQEDSSIRLISLEEFQQDSIFRDDTADLNYSNL